jgi:hypothetical protein
VRPALDSPYQMSPVCLFRAKQRQETAVMVPVEIILLLPYSAYDSPSTKDMHMSALSRASGLGLGYLPQIGLAALPWSHFGRYN